MMTDISHIFAFLPCKTPDTWIEVAQQNLKILLIDHANCEKKAAATALNLLYRYVDKSDLLHKLSRLAREELRHFERVLSIMQARDIEYTHLSPSRYAAGLRDPIRKDEPGRLIDTLIIGALIEARSCERFAALAPYLDEELAHFYRALLRSESRHYQDYLSLAKQYAQSDIGERIDYFKAVEAELINSPDTEFRFHSGVPFNSDTSSK